MKRAKKRPYRRVAFVVSFQRPPNASVGEMREYVENAVKSYKGGLMPPGVVEDCLEGDPMWPLDPETVVVRTYSVRPTSKEK